MEIYDAVPLWPLLAIAAIGGAWVVIREVFRSKGSDGAASEMPYRARRYLLSKAERSFYGVLRQAVPSGYCVFAKVRLADLVYVDRSAKHRQGALNRVSAKHVDFVVCEGDAVSPVLVVELDDSSHAQSFRRQRDRAVDAVLDAAGLPILHVPAARGYSVEALRGEIQCLLGAPSGSSAQGPITPTEPDPSAA